MSSNLDFGCIFANQIKYMASENIIDEKKQGQALVTDNSNGNTKKLFIVH